MNDLTNSITIYTLVPVKVGNISNSFIVLPVKRESQIGSNDSLDIFVKTSSNEIEQKEKNDSYLFEIHYCEMIIKYSYHFNKIVLPPNASITPKIQNPNSTQKSEYYLQIQVLPANISSTLKSKYYLQIQQYSQIKIVLPNPSIAPNQYITSRSLYYPHIKVLLPNPSITRKIQVFLQIQVLPPNTSSTLKSKYYLQSSTPKAMYQPQIKVLHPNQNITTQIQVLAPNKYLIFKIFLSHFGRFNNFQKSTYILDYLTQLLQKKRNRLIKIILNTWISVQYKNNSLHNRIVDKNCITFSY